MRLRDIALAAALLVGSLHAAAADVIYNYTLSGVGLTSSPTGGTKEGTLTGTFSYDSTTQAITALDIIASASGSFAGFTYTLSNSTVTALSPTQYLEIASSTDTYQLLIDFTTGGLTASGAGIASGSYEDELATGIRDLSSGSIKAAPEPASLALLGAGLLGLASTRRRRRG